MKQCSRNHNPDPGRRSDGTALSASPARWREAASGLALALALALALGGAFSRTTIARPAQTDEGGRQLAGDYTLRTRPPATATEQFVLRLADSSSTLTLALEPYSVRAPGFVLRVQQADGAFLDVNPGPSSTVRGDVLERPGARVAGSLVSGGFHGLLIDPSGPDQWIAPSPLQSAAGEEIYRLTPLGGSGSFPTKATLARLADERSSRAQPPGTDGTAQCALDGWCVAEIAVDVDHFAYLESSSDPLTVTERVEAIVNAGNLRFEQVFQITHPLTAVVVRAASARDPWVMCNDGNDCLVHLGVEWSNSRFPDIRRDTVRLFTGRNPSTGGLSPQGNICDNVNRGGWVKSLQLDCGRVALHIHELGHMWDSIHTVSGIMMQPPPACYETFSGSALTSIPAMRDLVEATCLDTFVDELLADDFDSGDLSAWPVVFDGGGLLSVFSGSGVLEGTHSLGVEIKGTRSLFVRDTALSEEPRYRARFLLDPGGLTMAELDRFVIFVGGTTAGDVILLELSRGEGLFGVRASVRRDDDVWVRSPTIPLLGKSSHSIEIDWRAATAPGADDGFLRLWIDEKLESDLAGIDNDQRRLDRISLGAILGIDDPGTEGTLVFDRYDSRRTSYIGP